MWRCVIQVIHFLGLIVFHVSKCCRIAEIEVRVIMLVFPLLLFPQGAFIRSINLHYAASNRIILFLKHAIRCGLEV